MSEPDSKNRMCADDAVEALLESASPRPAPPTTDEQIVRDAVLAEWQAVAGKRARQNHIRKFAIAATVLVAAIVAFNQFRMIGVAPVQVATISKSHGSIYLLGKQAELRELPELGTISAGQTIVTRAGAGLGLDWGNGGSLRIDQNSWIDFVSTDAIFLREGRVYFDSQPAAAVARIIGSGRPDSPLEIETNHGTVTHLGTQYMTRVDGDGLTVSVREGRVAIAGTYVDETATEGEQMRLAGRGQPTVLQIRGYGKEWEWIEKTAPVPQFDNKPVHDFLSWVSRETGLGIMYEDEEAQRLADEAFVGRVDMGPTQALEFWMQSIDLDYRIEGGVLHVTSVDTGSGQ